MSEILINLLKVTKLDTTLRFIECPFLFSLITIISCFFSCSWFHFIKEFCGGMCFLCSVYCCGCSYFLLRFVRESIQSLDLQDRILEIIKAFEKVIHKIVMNIAKECRLQKTHIY